MLTKLVSLLETKENGLSLAEISRLMNAQPSAVLSMIGLLVQKGKLIEIGPDGKCCTTCGYESECNLLAARGKRYMAAPAPTVFRTLRPFSGQRQSENGEGREGVQ
jgi:predicted Zn-ribbon and HTH transcriptional regulator